MNNDWDVIVVGAGLAGLVAGATATAGGARTLVLDGHGPGGRARCVEREGFTFNMGAHALYRGGAGWSVLGRLGITPTGAPPPLARYELLRHGDRHRLPTGPASLLATTALGVKGKAQFGRLMATLARVDAASVGEQSAGAWLQQRDLAPDVEGVVRALLRLGTYLDDLETASADGVLAQMQLGARKGVLYLHGGWSQLLDRLVAQVQLRRGVAVTGLDATAGRVVVQAGEESFHARRVVLACGTPAATAALLPTRPSAWYPVGPPVTAACLDVGLRRVPERGYLLGVDEPLYATTQSPPARQAPQGQAVVSVLRYGARTAELDRPNLEGHLARLGVTDTDIVTDRFLARMVVAGSAPLAATGGLGGRPGIDSSGMLDVGVAGDWVGPVGLLADASMASGEAAARAALRALEGSGAVV